MAEKPSRIRLDQDTYKTLSERGLFRNRHEPIKTFFDSLAKVRKDSLILLVYYGLGGQGKTALCNELIKRTREKNDGNIVLGHLDLHEREQLSGESSLLWIRNALAEHSKIVFPAFDLSFTMYWKATRPEQPLPYFTRHGWLSSASEFGEEAGIEFLDDLLSDLAESLTKGLIESIPGAAIIKRLLGWGSRKFRRYQLVNNNPDVKDLVTSEAKLLSAASLYRRLPILLANDIRRDAEKNAKCRIVLLIDEYERVFAEGGASTSLASNPFDEAIRMLIPQLDQTMVVIFSRERLPWSKYPPVGENAAAWSRWIDEAHHHVGGLSEKDARNILKGVSIEEESLIAAIIDGARITDDAESLIHSLMLELQIYHHDAIKNGGQAPTPEDFHTEEASYDSLRRRLVGRFIRDYHIQTQTLIKLLAVPRSRCFWRTSSIPPHRRASEAFSHHQFSSFRSKASRRPPDLSQSDPRVDPITI